MTTNRSTLSVADVRPDVLRANDLPDLGVTLYATDLLNPRGFETNLNDALWTWSFSQGFDSETTGIGQDETLRTELLIRLIIDHLVPTMPLQFSARVTTDFLMRPSAGRTNRIRIRPIHRYDQLDLEAKLAKLRPVDVTGEQIVQICSEIAPRRSEGWRKLYSAIIPSMIRHFRLRDGNVSLITARAEFLGPLRTYLDATAESFGDEELELAAEIITCSRAEPFPFFSRMFSQYMTSVFAGIRSGENR